MFFTQTDAMRARVESMYLEKFAPPPHPPPHPQHTKQTQVCFSVFCRTNMNLGVLIHIWTKDEVGAPLNQFKPSVLLTVPRRCFFCGSFMIFLSCFVMLSRTSVDALRSPAGEGLTSCHFPICILGQVWCLILLIPDLCPLPYFVSECNCLFP